MGDRLCDVTVVAENTYTIVLAMSPRLLKMRIE